MSTEPDPSNDSAWAAIRAGIEALPADVRASVWAAVVPRRFDASLLRVVLADPEVDVDALVERLRDLPYVTSHPAGGLAIAPVTRRRLLAEMRVKQRETLLAGSTRLTNYYTGILVGPAQAIGPWAGLLDQPLVRSVRAWLRRRQPRAGYVASTGGGVPFRIEQIYHAIAARPEWARETIMTQGIGWLREMEPNLAALKALTDAIAEQVQAGQASAKIKHWGWFLAADTALHRHDFDNAKRLFIRVVSRTQDDWLRANAAFGLAMVHRLTLASGKARASARLALAYYDAWSNAPGQANCHWLLGYLDLQEHRLDYAKRSVLRAMSLLRRPSHNLNERANCYWTLGEIEAERESYESAHAYYDKARALYGQAGSRLGSCNCLTSLGSLALRHGRLLEAQRYLVEAQALAEAMAVRLSIANVLDDLARVHERLREFDRAAAHFETAATLHRAIQNPVSEANALIRLGGVDSARNSPAKARASIERGLTILRAQGRPDSLSVGLARAAALEIQQEAFADAIETLRAGARVADSGHAVALRAELQRRLARLFIDRSELELAAEALRAADGALGADTGYPLTRAANQACAADLAIARGDLREAREHVDLAAGQYGSAASGARASWYARQCGELDIMAGDLDTGCRRLDEAYRLAAGPEAANERLACQESLALGNALLGKYAAAVEHLSSAIDGDAYPPAYLWLARADQYRRLGDLTATQNDLDAAATAGAARSALALSRSQLALAAGRPAAALTEIATVLENWPRHLLARLTLGLAHLAAGRADQALELVHGALAANTVFPSYIAHVELQLTIVDLLSNTGPDTGIAYAIAHQITDHLRSFPRGR